MLGLFDSAFNNLFDDGKKGKSVRNKSRVPDKISIAQFFDKYANKEDIQNALYSLDVPISGVKEDLIKRILKATNDLPSDQVLDLLNKDSLKDACSDYDLLVSGNKNDLIDRIVTNVIKETRTSSTVETPRTNYVQTKPSVSNPKELDFPPDVVVKNEPSLSSILKWFSKDDIERGLKDQGLSTSGTKEAMINRLLAATNGDSKMTLMSLDGQKMNVYAEDNKIPRRRGKEDQVDEILKQKLGISKTPSITTNARQPTASIPKTSSYSFEKPVRNEGEDLQLNLKEKYDQVCDYIDKWVPSESWPEEGGYRTDLYHYLRYKYSNVKIESGGTKIDIVVDEQIPIELKLAPDQKEYQRAFEQAYRHMEQYGILIEVLCRPKVQSYLHEFEDRVQRMAKPNNWLYKLIVK